MNDIHLEGVIPAAILPMTADYMPAYDAFERYLSWLINENAVALAINMDTGEGPQLTMAERQRAVESAVRVAEGKCLVLAGVMGATTQGAVEVAKLYHTSGADAVVVFPNAAFRNEPLDPQIPYEYHKAIADETGLPIVLFQLAPVFGGVLYSRETLLKMLEIPNVVAIKEASFDLQYFIYTKETLDMADRRITLLTGNDRFITESFLFGAKGALLGFCAIGCGMVAEMLDHFAKGDIKEGVVMRERVQGFADFIYKDPILDYRARCKVALSHIGLLDQGQTFVRPPMLQIGEEESLKIQEALNIAGMLEVEGLNV